MPGNFPAGQLLRKAGKSFGVCIVNYSMSETNEKQRMPTLSRVVEIGSTHPTTFTVRIIHRNDYLPTFFLPILANGGRGGGGTPTPGKKG